jgi:hypothetical protein
MNGGHLYTNIEWFRNPGAEPFRKPLGSGLNNYVVCICNEVIFKISGDTFDYVSIYSRY